MIRVLVVEDEPDLRSSIIIFLRGLGMSANGVEDAVAMDAALMREPVDVVILDVNLPGENGFSIAARLRTSMPIGIIMLSARDSADDQIIGLASGADSYLSKPIDLRVLSAAVRSLALRMSKAEQDDPKDELDAWGFESSTWLLTAPNGVSVELSGNEQRVLSMLMTESGRPVSREAIMGMLGKTGNESDDYSLNAMIARMRRKVSAATGFDLPIKAVRAVGYAFAAPVRTTYKRPDLAS
jgi:DNA-binding response OmpR family regulator